MLITWVPSPMSLRSGLLPLKTRRAGLIGFGFPSLPLPAPTAPPGRRGSHAAMGCPAVSFHRRRPNYALYSHGPVQSRHRATHGFWCRQLSFCRINFSVRHCFTSKVPCQTSCNLPRFRAASPAPCARKSKGAVSVWSLRRFMIRQPMKRLPLPIKVLSDGVCFSK